MAKKTILSKNQSQILSLLSQNKNICHSFYLTGGTALAEYYLHHRLSEDLDFFSETEVESESIFACLKSLKTKAKIKKIDAQKSFNRNLFFLHLSDGDIIKTEFTFFPFPRIEQKMKIEQLYVDSLLDIAVNKVFTIYQKPRSRDFIDLYLILHSQKWTIPELVKKARIKFDWHVDPLQLASQFLRANEIEDFPRMIIKLQPKVWRDFFTKESIKLSPQIFSTN